MTETEDTIATTTRVQETETDAEDEEATIGTTTRA